MRACALLLAIVVGIGSCLGAAGPVLAGIAVPDVTAASVFAFDPDSGEVILEKNADEPRQIGSVTKVVTALVVLDHLQLDDELVVASSDMVASGYSSMGLQPGDTLTTEQLLTGLLVVSGGDAAWTFARTIGMELCACDDLDDATAAFVDAMNGKAEDLGATDSNFANPDGEDAEGAHSTARDVATLYATLAANPGLAAIAAEASYSFTSVGPEATLYEGATTNQLAGTNGIISAKTGSEIDAGGCIVFAQDSTKAGPIIIAVLGSNLEYDETTWTPTVDDRWTDATTVIEVIDAAWEPGAFLAAPQPTDVPPASTNLDAPSTGSQAGSFDAAQPVEVPRDGKVNGSRGGPLLVVTVATGVLLFAAVFAWAGIAGGPAPVTGLVERR